MFDPQGFNVCMLIRKFLLKKKRPQGVHTRYKKVQERQITLRLLIDSLLETFRSHRIAEKKKENEVFAWIRSDNLR